MNFNRYKSYINCRPINRLAFAIELKFLFVVVVFVELITLRAGLLADIFDREGEKEVLSALHQAFEVAVAPTPGLLKILFLSSNWILGASIHRWF